MAQIALRKRIFSTSALSSILGKLGDMVVDITKPTVVVFDGSTPGGIPLAKETHTHPNATESAAGFESADDKTTLDSLAAIGSANASSSGYMSAADYNLLQSLAASSSSGIPNNSGNVPNTLVLRDSSGNFAANIITAAFVGSLTGNASTVTNGVVTTGTYADPSWITSLNGSKITGTIGSSVVFSGSVPWTSITGKPSVVSYFVNDAGYINATGNTTGTSGGVLSSGGRETSSPTANTMVLRSSTGTAQVATPVAANDIATKAYVDANASGAGYWPQSAANLASQPFGVSTVNPFSINIVNDSSAGYIKSIYIDVSALNFYKDASSNTGVGKLCQDVFLGITSDGHTETSFSLFELIQSFGERTEVNITTTTGNVNGMGNNGWIFKVVMDLPYKSSMVIRAYTSTTFSVLSSPNSEFVISVYRYLKS